MRKIYNTPERKVHALGNINLDMEDGEFLCLVGLSGFGKTTLLNILSGFVEITSGRVMMNGKPITDVCDRGVVFQEYALSPWRTALKNVEYGLEIRKVPQKNAAKPLSRNRDIQLFSHFDHLVPYPFL